MKISEIKPKVYTLAAEAEKQIEPQFKLIDEVCQKNTYKVIQAFQDNKVSESCFAGTTGYGYDDLGRDTLDKLYAQVFGTESALVRLNFVNGTHAIKTALFSMVKPGDAILSLTGMPYDTLRKAIGIGSTEFGSLKYYGIDFIEGSFEDLNNKTVKAVILQRSCGYSDRPALSIDKIGEICQRVRELRDDVYIFCDNCYGEFTEIKEPTDVGVDIIAGSLIKNPGGGIAPTGAYIAGKQELIERAAYILTSPGIGAECGSTLGNNRLLYQGVFFAPHTVAQALKTAVFASKITELVGIESDPAFDAKRSDIIQRLKLGDKDRMIRFCEGIQSGAPVDSFVKPVPWPMPGYDCDVIMADGSFIQGSSIELSADGPMKEPYNLYLQGGLTYESGKLGIMMAVSSLLDD